MVVIYIVLVALHCRRIWRLTIICDRMLGLGRFTSDRIAKSYFIGNII
jgi:hypothetical protein